MSEQPEQQNDQNEESERDGASDPESTVPADQTVEGMGDVEVGEETTDP